MPRPRTLWKLIGIPLLIIGVMLVIAVTSMVRVRVHQVAILSDGCCQQICNDIVADRSLSNIKESLARCPQCSTAVLSGGFLILHSAVVKRRLDVVKELVDLGADPFMRGSDDRGVPRMSAMELAAASGNIECVKFFLQQVSEETDRKALLEAARYAANKGYPELSTEIMEVLSSREKAPR